MKVIKLRNTLTVILNDGTVLTDNNCNADKHQLVLDNQDNEDTVKFIMIPEMYKKREEIETKTKMLSDISESDYMTVNGASIYIKSISELSVPEDFAMALHKAEEDENEDLIQSYLNFWTLTSMNPDSRVRGNMFWFLDRYGMTISKSGLFVAFRNVALKSEGSDISSELAAFISDNYSKVKFRWKKSPANYFVIESDFADLILVKDPSEYEEDGLVVGRLDKLYEELGNAEVAPVYTDVYSRTFTIKIGEPVTMPREKCDPVQTNTCSSGLHVAGKEWLQSNYFGDTGLMVLVNPADVVAVPPQDSYGKMRVCAYYPVQIVGVNEKGGIEMEDIEDGFEDNFIDIITYDGEINNEDTSNYSISIPDTPELSRSRIMNRLQDIKQSISNKLSK